MHIEPVFAEFNHVTIRRTGGIMGMDQTMRLDRSLRAEITDRRRDTNRTMQLDAITSQQLMSALARFAERRPEPSTKRGCDMFHYDIELSWNGTTYRVRSVDLGADEALRGVMLAARRLLDQQQDDYHMMELHAQPHVDAPTPA